jgi:hypothetical protein
MELTLIVNAPAVVAEIIDGEAVIMDLATGHYFSTQHAGSDIWRGIELGASQATIARFLAASYGVEPDVASEAVATFVDELKQRKLVLETNGRLPAQEESGNWMTATGRPFSRPVLQSYTDLEELLLLDPIHDVDQAGWPMPKAPDETAS